MEKAIMVNGITNAQRFHLLNMATPQFHIDATTGRINFTRFFDFARL